MNKKKLFVTALTLGLSFSLLSAKPLNKTMTSLEVVNNLGFGWNLGNTLDATHGKGLSAEKSWGQPLTTKEMIDGLAASGIKSIRIPVSWHTHLTNTNNYTIDSEWMARVKTIVDWAIEDDLYVILNIHHDNAESSADMKKPGAGFYPNEANREESIRYVTSIWAQISKTFNNDYDEHLIFETLNEPRLIGHNHEWNPVMSCADCRSSQQIVNEMNQKIVDTIRSSGGNNSFRFIGIPGITCSADAVLSSNFELPKDSVKDRLLVAVHMYAPYDFAMNPRTDTKTFTKAYEYQLQKVFDRLAEKFTSKGTGVYVGEMGATNKNNLAEREKWFAFYVSHTREKNMSCLLWDNGGYDASNGDFEEKYGYYCRNQAKWYFPTLIEAAIKASDGTVKKLPEYDSNFAYGFNFKNAKNVLKSEFDTDSWNKSTILPADAFKNVKEGSVICIKTGTSVSKDKNYRKLSFRDTSWKEFDEFTGECLGDGSLDGSSVSPKSDNTTYYFVLSAKDAATLKGRQILLCGNNVKVVSIQVLE